MFIEKVILNNFRVYKGINEINLSVNHDLNVSVVSGNNGYGKTSLLTSLVWCLYGKLMADVDERYRKEIYESGGYKRFCDKIMNRVTALESEEDMEHLLKSLVQATAIEKNEINRKITDLNSFSVSIRLTKIFIPSIPCEYVQITRTYNVYLKEETVEILIDGRANELTKEVGHEIFINDFILPKEIAKFFFFDAEKIVSLAEIRSIEEKEILAWPMQKFWVLKSIWI
ncbi:AAA family ATPase [Paraflavitalea speifideaquila]|uniref:AAA family ATPase n=1 Tax=Paraflavitalea speifideaquila TaxID=3076558 RepID=UPI0028EF0049|nr:AAA family ATPase [Paraflavitalea speifideiaquila]